MCLGQQVHVTEQEFMLLLHSSSLILKDGDIEKEMMKFSLLLLSFPCLPASDLFFCQAANCSRQGKGVNMHKKVWHEAHSGSSCMHKQ